MAGRSASLLLALLLLGAQALPAQARPLGQPGTATLSIVAGQVEVQTPGGSGFGRGSDGQTLAVGTRLRTPADGRAVLTFFDGTTVSLDPNTEITLEQVQPSGEQPGGLSVGVGLTVGRLWAQVTSLFDRGSSFEVRAAGATAVAREGVTGFGRPGPAGTATPHGVVPEGTLLCWNIAGRPLFVRSGDTEIELLPGQEVAVREDQPAGSIFPRPFGAGVLEVRSEGPVLARLVNPANLTVGFALEDLVVNQIMDASTSAPDARTRWIRLPGPAAGQYQLVIQPSGSGPYRVRAALGLDGRDLFAREWSGTAAQGQQLIATLIVEAAGGVPSGGAADDLQPLVGQAPGNFIYP
jgi:hypothetical protein